MAVTDDDDQGGGGLSYDDDSVEVTGGEGVYLEKVTEGDKGEGGSQDPLKKVTSFMTYWFLELFGNFLGVAVYSRKLQCFFFDILLITRSTDNRVHRAGSQLKIIEIFNYKQRLLSMVMKTFRHS